MNSYELSKNWFDWCFENPEKISPTHTAMYFFIIEHCNRLGWKEKFGLPMEMTKDAIGIKNYRTFTNTFQDLVEWGFIKVIQKSKNQYSSNIIAIAENTIARTKALSKAMQKHSQKQVHGIVGIDKPNNYITKNNILMSEVSLSDLPDDNEKLYFKMAKGFYDQFEKNAIELKTNFSALKKATYEKWVSPIRLLITSDGHTIEEIRDVLRFLRDEDINGKEFTWKKNVQCTSTLRAKSKNGLTKFENIIIDSRRQVTQQGKKPIISKEKFNELNQGL